MVLSKQNMSIFVSISTSTKAQITFLCLKLCQNRNYDLTGNFFLEFLFVTKENFGLTVINHTLSKNAKKANTFKTKCPTIPDFSPKYRYVKKK